ncbi:MAG: riboflavin kinase [Candidatus Hydrogenedentota bacterium]
MKSITLDLAAEPMAADPLIEVGALTIGVFDGLHLGHRSLIETLVRESRGSGAALVTFTEHPRVLLAGHGPVRILHPRLKNRILSEWGVTVIVLLEMNRGLLSLDPREFLDRLFSRISTGKVVIGPNFHFGRGRTGTVEMLRQHGREDVVVVDPMALEGELASATRIRNLLSTADLAAAARMTGREFSVLATPRSGDGIGRTMGSPTLNLYPVPEALPDGVYAVRSPFGPAVCHVGPRPTLGSKERRFEVHVLEGNPSPADTDEIEITFVEKLRNVETFASIGDLQAAIAADVARAREMLG